MLATHLTELIKANMSELLSYGEVQKLIKELPKEQGELIKDIVPAQITISGIQRVLQILLAERVSIRDLATILEGIADGLRPTRNPAMLAEHVRARLARQLCAQHIEPGRLSADHRAVRQMGAGFRRIHRRPGRRPQSRDAAVQAHRIHQRWCARNSSKPAREGEAPVLVTSPGIRPFVRGIVERFRAQTSVLAQSEIHPRARLKDGREHLKRLCAFGAGITNAAVKARPRGR